MKAHIEPVCGVLRVYEQGKTFEGKDDYVWSATVRWVDRHSVEIMGVVKAPTIPVWRAISELMKDEASGIRRVLIRRHGRLKVYRTKVKDN